MLDSFSSQNKRFTIFDVAKGLGILLVVFAHLNHTQEALVYIYSFHMPLFFIISGLFFDKNKYTFGNFIKNRFLRLICPYLFFYLIILMFDVCFAFVINKFSIQAIQKFKQPLLQMFIAQGSSKVISAPLWFVPCLFVVEILYYFIAKLNKYLIGTICAILVVCGWLLETKFSHISSYLPWSIDSALFSIGFYALGNMFSGLLKNIIRKIEEHKHAKVISLCTALLCFICLIPLAFLNGKVSLGSKILNNGLLFYLTGIIGSLAIFFLSIVLSNFKFLSFLGRNTFCIMAIHYFINYYLTLIIVKLGFTGYDNTNILHSIIPFLIVLALSIVVVIIYNYFKSKIFCRKKLNK